MTTSSKPEQFKDSLSVGEMHRLVYEIQISKSTKFTTTLRNQIQKQDKKDQQEEKEIKEIKEIKEEEEIGKNIHDTFHDDKENNIDSSFKINNNTQDKEKDVSPLVRITVRNNHSGSRFLPFSDRLWGPYSLGCNFTAHKLNTKSNNNNNNNENNSNNNNINNINKLEDYSALNEKTIPSLRLIKGWKGIEINQEDYHMVGVPNLFSNRSVVVNLHEYESTDNTNDSMETYYLIINITNELRLHEDQIPVEVKLEPFNETISTKLVQHDKIKEYIEPPKDAKHLIVLIHGLNGSRNDLHYIYERLLRHIRKEKLPAYVVVPTVNQCLTREGIIPNGKRIANEILSCVNKMNVPDEEITLSLVGYSLGGILARYAAGWLQEHYFEQWNTWRKLNFITFASPHVSGKENLWPIRLGAHVIGATGREIMLRDHAEKPLLLEMSRPGTCYMAALESFENRHLYSNMKGDPLVGYCTGAIRAENPYLSRFKEFKDPVVIIDEDDSTEDDKHDSAAYQSWIRSNTDDFIVEMLKNLNRLSWKRSSIYFGGPSLENDHRNIIVRRELLNQIAKPVIEHFVQNFVFE